MKAEYLRTAEVAEELRLSLSKARQLMKDEMTCLAIGGGPPEPAWWSAPNWSAGSSGNWNRRRLRPSRSCRSQGSR